LTCGKTSVQTPLKCSHRAQIDSRLAMSALAESGGSRGILMTATFGTARTSELAMQRSLRLDIHIEVPAVPISALRDMQPGADSATLRKQVRRAVSAQRERFGSNSPKTNGRMSSRELRNYAAIDADGERVLRQAVRELGMSARAHDKVLRVARTIADLVSEENVSSTHPSEAIQYRRLDRSL
jgi:predicted ATPase with chaperone activity